MPLLTQNLKLNLSLGSAPLGMVQGHAATPGCLQGNLGIAQLEDVAETAGHVASASDTDLRPPMSQVQ